MSDADKNSIYNVSKNVLKYTNPLAWLVIEATEKAIGKSNVVTETGDIEEMKKESLRQELASKMAENQAKVAQEIAIARRIDTAEEVTIEEFYGSSGEGKIGLNSDGENITFGINGAGRRVTKRIYTFKGWRDGGLDVIDSLKENSK